MQSSCQNVNLEIIEYASFFSVICIHICTENACNQNVTFLPSVLKPCAIPLFYTSSYTYEYKSLKNLASLNISRFTI